MALANGNGWWNFRKFAITPPLIIILPRVSRGRRQNFLGQLRELCPLRGKKVQRNLLNVENKGQSFWKNSILLVNISKEHFYCHWFTWNIRIHFLSLSLLFCKKDFLLTTYCKNFMQLMLEIKLFEITMAIFTLNL